MVDARNPRVQKRLLEGMSCTYFVLELLGAVRSINYDNNNNCMFIHIRLLIIT